MFSAPHRSWFFPALAGVLVIALPGQCFLASRLKSPTWDEPAHIAAALSYWLTDKMTVNLQHPLYIIPLLPFAYLMGGMALAHLARNREIWKCAIAGIFCAWMIATAIGIYPDHLSYFNETACLLTEPRLIRLDGGSRCGTLWLDDSNVDWGGA
jgi:surface polysaccharide O-acyltransferase-like enzyme